MKRLAGIVALVALMSGGAIEAHHSHAMFDTSKELSLIGMVTRVAFANPHVFLYMDVTGPKGQPVTWAIEMSNISNMERRGIYRGTFKIGEMVTVKVNPLRDGRSGGNYTSITGADGKVYE